ncbi:MAG: hypothetical protein POELPBGB_00263 [Bacteroidia bacterium]|nr:hypothetical protein [Bacteroidia bacterium]
MNNQCTSHVLMIRPASFGYNEETAANNIYQQKPANTDILSIQQQALNEFDAFTQNLSEKGVNVILLPDTPEHPKPDALFPNNWVSFHEDGTVVLYPMYAANRRKERRKDIIEVVEKQCSFRLSQVIDLTHYEQHNKFLEGTGSLVLDRENKIAYASVSGRTNPQLVYEFCRKMNYKPLIFHSSANGVAVYHTNVVMSVCSNFVVICMDYITSETEQKTLLDSFKQTNKEVLLITARQAAHFTGNVLEVQTDEGKTHVIMSSAAYRAFNPEQLQIIKKYCGIIHSPLDTIEKHGGGSARCMLAEVFLPLT